MNGFDQNMSMPGGFSPIPVQRVIDKMNDYMSRLDYAGAERHLNYWLAEARAGGDRRGELTVLNELIGHCRKTGQKEAAERYSREALELIDALELGSSVSVGTTYINIATAAYVFGDYECSIGMFERAEKIYRGSRQVDARLMGGLYNNMGLTLTALRRWDEAMEAYRKALSCMQDVPGGAPEQAETCLNMANTLEYRYGAVEAEEQINELLDRAEALLDSPDVVKDGYFAYICDHCAPTFEHYGYFLTAAKLKDWTKRYYERT